jgi:hypothetical protein
MQRSAPVLTDSPRVRLTVRVLAAVLILFVGADHYYEYAVQEYSLLPTIGTLFLLNFISATVIGVLLLAPLDRIFHRFGKAVLAIAALSGLGIAATSLAALLVSEQTALFGFMEVNYRATILVALATEGAAAVCLGLLLVLTLRARRSASGLRTRVADHARPSAGTT